VPKISLLILTLLLIASPAHAELAVLPGKYVSLHTNVPQSKEILALPAFLDLALVEQAKILVPDMTQRTALLNRLATQEKIRAVLLDNKEPPAEVLKQLAKHGYTPKDFTDGFAVRGNYWVRRQPLFRFMQGIFLHEQVHAIMQRTYGHSGPVWYSEALAESLSRFRFSADGKKLLLGGMPYSKKEIPGFSRIKNLQRIVKERPTIALDDVFRVEMADVPERKAEPSLGNALVLSQEDAYPLYWALGMLLSCDPNYANAFFSAATEVNKPDFTIRFRKALGEKLPLARMQWFAFVAAIDYGYDFTSEQFAPAKQKRPTEQGTFFTLDAASGWTNSGVSIRAGQTKQIFARGRFQIAKPQGVVWEAEPNGITLRYFRGRPLGELLVAVGPPDGTTGKKNPFLKVSPAGKKGSITSQQDGVLYFRLNDSPAQLGDNAGSVEVFVGK